MALSMSVSAGAHNARHNTDLAYRASLRNVDADLSVGNISIRDVPIAEAYETVFGDSLRAYNAKQKSKGHPERCIGDYLSKIEKAYSDDSARVKSGNKGRVNVPKPCYEYVLQIGNRDTFGGEQRPQPHTASSEGSWTATASISTCRSTSRRCAITTS